MIERKYSWKYGHGGVSAEVAGETIKAIEDRDGVVTGESFLEASRPEDAPTHKCFEWDDTKAAEKWRLSQANQVIRDIVVTITDDEGDLEPVTVPLFINTAKRVVEPARFKSVEIAVQQDDDYSMILNNAVTELKLFKNKYARIKELRGVFNEIDKLTAN